MSNPTPVGIVINTCTVKCKPKKKAKRYCLQYDQFLCYWPNVVFGYEDNLTETTSCCIHETLTIQRSNEQHGKTNGQQGVGGEGDEGGLMRGSAMRHGFLKYHCFFFLVYSTSWSHTGSEIEKRETLHKSSKSTEAASSTSFQISKTKSTSH